MFLPVVSLSYRITRHLFRNAYRIANRSANFIKLLRESDINIITTRKGRGRRNNRWNASFVDVFVLQIDRLRL